MTNAFFIMILYIDIEKKRLVTGLANTRTVAAPEFTQNDNEPLEIHLCEQGDENATYYDKIFSPSVDFLRVAIAKFGETNEILSYSDDITPLDSGGVSMTLPLNTTALETNLDGKKSISAYLEIEYSNANGKIRTVLQTACTVLNDLIENAPAVELQSQFYDKAFLDRVFSRQNPNRAIILDCLPCLNILPTDATIEIRDNENLLYATSTVASEHLGRYTRPTNDERIYTDIEKYDANARVYFRGEFVGFSTHDLIPYFENIFGSVYKQARLMSELGKPFNGLNGLVIFPNVNGDLPDGSHVCDIINERNPYLPAAKIQQGTYELKNANENPIWATVVPQAFTDLHKTITEITADFSTVATVEKCEGNHLVAIDTTAAISVDLGVSIAANKYALITFSDRAEQPYLMAEGTRLNYTDLTVDENGGLWLGNALVSLPLYCSEEIYESEYKNAVKWTADAEESGSGSASGSGSSSGSGSGSGSGTADAEESPAFAMSLSATNGYETINYGNQSQFGHWTYSDEQKENVYTPPVTDAEIIDNSISFKIFEGRYCQHFALIKTGEESTALSFSIPTGATLQISNLNIITWGA